MLLEKRGEGEAAMAVMEEILRLQPEHAEAINFIAYSLAERGRDLDRALRLAEQALALRDRPHIRDTLGWVHYKRGNFAEALKHLEKALAEMGEDPVLHEHIGDTLTALGRNREAGEAYRKSLELDPENQALRDKLDKMEGKP